MRISIEPFDAKNPRFGPFNFVKHLSIYRTVGAPNNFLKVPDIQMDYENGKHEGIILPANQIYSVNVSEE